MAIWHDVQQNTTAWRNLRLGIPTSSRFSDIITPSTGKLSRSSDSYANVLLYEWATGLPWIGYQSKAMEDGQEFEGQGVDNYTFQTGRNTSNGGFFTVDSGMIGCSPDRRAGPGRLLQIKCPQGPTHVGYMLTGKIGEEYRCQLQGELYVSECEYDDIVSHVSSLPPVIITVARDEGYIKILSAALDQFVESLLAKRDTLSQRYGPFPLPKSLPADSPDNPFGVSMLDAEQIISSWSEQ